MEVDTSVCPHCDSLFSSLDALVQHLNAGNADCVSTLEDSSKAPAPSAFIRGEGETNSEDQYHKYTHGRGMTLLDRLKTHEHESHRQYQLYYPFPNKTEWDLGKFLVLHMKRESIPEFLEIQQALSGHKPSYETVDRLFSWVENLPTGPRWLSSKTDIKSHGRVPYASYLIWRDGLEVVKDLFSNPLFADYMTYHPYKVIRDEEREYSEFFTGTRAFEIQDQLPEGSTIVPIILASDTTSAMYSGGLKMYPIFMTIGNICSNVRMKATSHAWRCVALIPAEFKDRSELKPILQARVFHWSLDIVTATLKAATDKGCSLVDPRGNIRNCYFPLVSYIGDFFEQQLVACVSENAPVTTAEVPQFGGPAPATPQTSQEMLGQIKELCELVNPRHSGVSQKAAKPRKLPFWRDWKFSDPCFFLTGLQSGRQFFFDHVPRWCKAMAGSNTLNSRGSGLHHRVPRQVQMTRRELDDINGTVVPLLDGVANVADEFVYAVRALLEFIYRAQSPVHTDSSIAAMEQALVEFYAKKQSIGKYANEIVKYPELEMMKNFGRQIKANGSLTQFSTDVTDRLIIMHCRGLFERAARQDRMPVGQIIEYLNQVETIRMFDVYLFLRQETSSTMDEIISAEQKHVSATERDDMGVDNGGESIRQVKPKEELTFHGPPLGDRVDNSDSFISTNGVIDFHVAIRPDHKLSVVEMQALYKLPDLPQVMSRYIDEASQGNSTCAWNVQGSVQTWSKFQVQLHSLPSHLRFAERSQVVQAYPPSDKYRLGYCDAVLLRRPNNSYYVAQVRAVFRPEAKEKLPPYLAASPLCYVRFFRVLPRSASIGLYQVERVSTGLATGIVPLTEVVRALDLVPIFETQFHDMPRSSKTCMEGYQRYYLNTLVDKETFHDLHLQSQ